MNSRHTNFACMPAASLPSVIPLTCNRPMSVTPAASQIIFCSYTKCSYAWIMRSNITIQTPQDRDHPAGHAVRQSKLIHWYGAYLWSLRYFTYPHPVVGQNHSRQETDVAIIKGHLSILNPWLGMSGASSR
jgi:hypothetical protein